MHLPIHIDIFFTINIEKKSGQGEDADPIALQEGQSVLIGVFDGLGGAGSTVYESRGTKHSGAYHASRITSDLVRKLFHDAIIGSQTKAGDNPIDEDFVRQLKISISHELKKRLEELESTPSKLRSSLIRRLPTTMAVMYLDIAQADESTCISIWAGDSRCYSFDPDSGLCQLSRDDLKSGGDAFENLKEDSPLSNYINADSDFELHFKVDNSTRPTIFITATDGCFGYLRSPMHFEYLLLDTMYKAKDAEEWKQLLIQEISRLTGDDASLALCVVGWPSFESLKDACLDRYKLLLTQYVQPLDKIDDQIAQAASKLASEHQHREDLQKRLWNMYRQTYESFPNHTVSQSIDERR